MPKKNENTPAPGGPRLLAGGNPQIPKGDGDALTFFAGAELDPVPPVDFKDPNEKAFHIHQDDELDEEQLTSWFEQAAAIPGWTP